MQRGPSVIFVTHLRDDRRRNCSRLRTTVSLTRMMQKKSRRGEARAMLAPIYRWSTEVSLLKTPNALKSLEFWDGQRSVAGMLTLLRFIVSVLVRRFRSRAVLELENLALRHQLHVLRRQRPGRPRLFAIDRLLWVLLYRLWPCCREVMVLVKPATVIQWHHQGFRLFWRWRSRSGRPSTRRVNHDGSALSRNLCTPNGPSCSTLLRAASQQSTGP
jgi:hypothetical protein